jgi:hypothetical protein
MRRDAQTAVRGGNVFGHFGWGYPKAFCPISNDWTEAFGFADRILKSTSSIQIMFGLSNQIEHSNEYEEPSK